jgi:hypothetical protein
MNPESLRIILRTYSKGGINEDETVQLIEDLYNKTTINNYPYVPYWPQITYTDGEPKFQKYEITCKTE